MTSFCRSFRSFGFEVSSPTDYIEPGTKRPPRTIGPNAIDFEPATKRARRSVTPTGDKILPDFDNVHVQRPVASEGTFDATRNALSCLFGLWSRCVGFEHWQHASTSCIAADSLELYARYAAEGAAVFITEAGFFGFAPRGVRTGDEIVLLRCAYAPAVLRPTEGCYTFHGLSYVHGIMYKELDHICPDMMWEERQFKIK